MLKAFYQSVHYESLRDRKVRRASPGSDITFSDRHPAARDFMLDYFETTSIERVGILHGEYMLHYSGMLLSDRSGVLTAADMSLEDSGFAQFLASFVKQPEFDAQLRELIGGFDRMPLVGSPPVLCDPYCKNYFHFSLEMIPRLRYFAADGETPVIMTSESLKRPFQRDLARRTFSRRRVLPLEGGVRVRDPILAHDSMSDEGIHWLRQASGISSRPGRRRIYIRRNVRGTRMTHGGGISQSNGFETLLRDFGFETVDFGDGEHGVAAQVAMLEGAGLVLSAHGAALTNLAYLHPDLTVIEVIGPRTQSACFMHLATTLGFGYHGIFSDVYDDDANIVVDLDELQEALLCRL